MFKNNNIKQIINYLDILLIYFHIIFIVINSIQVVNISNQILLMHKTLC
jgi:hypothetical protein